MKLIKVLLMTLFIDYAVVHGDESYFLSQPVAPQNAQEAAVYHAYLSKEFLDDLDAEHRLLLEDFIKETQRKKDGYERLRTLEALGSLNLNNPFVAGTFMDISNSIVKILTRTIRIFDVLIPTMNLLHNYFDILERLSEGASLDVFRSLHRTFLISIKNYAQQLYGEGLWYKRRGHIQEALNHFQIAQGLLYQMKDFDPEALALYNELDALEPSEFKKELARIGAISQGKPAQGNP